jgi:hypothetical protein
LLFATPLWAQEQPSAYEALRVLARESGRDAVNHVVSVVGINGTPQPERWKILVDDARSREGVREVEIADGGVVSQREAGRAVAGSSEEATINTARLNLDSTGAYAVASHTADKSSAQFARVSYTLRTDERGEPIWIVTLQDDSGRPVGTIHISANRGNVTRTEGLFAGATMQDVETDRDLEREGESDRGILSRTKSGISHAFYIAQQEARGMFERVKRSFSDFINGD